MQADNIMRVVKTVLFIIPLLVILAGCGDEFVGPSAVGVIMPLKVGNQWIGRWTIRGASGSTSFTFDTLTIVSEVQRGNERWYVGSDSVLYTNRADGLWRYSEEVNACIGEVLIAKYPSALSDTFGVCTPMVMSRNGIVPASNSHGAVVLAKDSAVTAPAGIYFCHLYARITMSPPSDGINLDSYIRDYYAPNIGPVRKTSYNDTFITSRTWELVSVTLR